MALDSMQEIFDKIEKTNKPFWRVFRGLTVFVETPFFSF